MKNQIRYRVLSLTVATIMLLNSACTDVKTNYVARVKLSSLAEADIYNEQKAYDVIFDSEETKNDSVKNKSRQLFLKAIDLYKNKKNAAAAVELFKQSILLFPDAKVYYELGNALLDSKVAYKEAEKAYDVAGYLNFKPASMLYFKKACAENMQESDSEIRWGVVYTLRSAFNEGFSDTALIRKDPFIRSIAGTDEYKSLLAEMSAMKFRNDPEDFFDLYIKSFPVASQPYEISLANAGKNSSQSISYDFAEFIPEMQNTSFGREVSHDFYVVAKVAENANYIAVIYSSVNFWGGEMQPVSKKLVTYDHQGHIIASKLFAGEFSAEKVKKGRLENNQLILEDYTRVWKYPIGDVSFENNEVDKYELIAKAQYLLDDSGKIIEQSVPANYSDSVILVKN
jgi:hypothetical protein